MKLWGLTVFALWAYLALADGQTLSTTSLLPSRDWIKKPICTSPKECDTNDDCCGTDFCFSCPLCDGVPIRPRTCFKQGDPLPPCAAPVSCDLICPQRDCDSSADCCDFQLCYKCPSCGRSAFQSKGKCVSKQTGSGVLSVAKSCRPCKLDFECESRSDCPKHLPFCNRCPRCDGPNGLEFDRPGRCGAAIISCAAPGPCDGLPFLATTGP